MARFSSLDVNGLRDVNKPMSLLQWLSHLNLDFVCLQETHVVSHSECLSWFSSYGFLTVASPGLVHSCGCYTLPFKVSSCEDVVGLKWTICYG